MARKQPGGTQPYLHHDTLTQAEQSRFLGRSVECTKNLGHDSTVDRLTENPAGRMMNYDSADTARTFRDPSKLQGVYRKTGDPRSGISSEANIDAWGRRASVNSYHGKDGKDPTMRDPRGSHTNESDGYLRSTKDWANLPDAGAESGEGRLQKSGKR